MENEERPADEAERDEQNTDAFQNKYERLFQPLVRQLAFDMANASTFEERVAYGQILGRVADVMSSFSRPS